MNIPGYRNWVYTLLAATVTLTCQPLAADTWASVKGMGMGHTGAVFPQDTLCAAYNPAGMVFQGNRVDIESTWSQRNGGMFVEGNILAGGNGYRNASRGKDQWGPAFGINWMICNSTDASVGITGYIHDHVHASYNQAVPAYGTDHLNFDWLVGTIATTLALRFDGQAIGVSALFHETRFKIDGLEQFDVATTTTLPVVLGFTASPGNVTGRGANMAQGFGVSIGWMGRLAPWLRAGVAWEIPIWQQRLPKYAGFIPYDQRMIPPQRITGGVHFNFCKTVNVVFEAQQILWRMNKLFRHHGFTSIENLQTAPFGSRDGPGFGWHGQTNLRAGGDVKIENLVLRIGGSWTRIPTRRSQTYLNALTLEIIQTWITTGFTYRFLCNWELSGFYAHGFKRTMTPTQEIPTLTLGGGQVSLNAQEDRAGLALGYTW